VSAVFEAWENEAMRQHVVPLAQALLDQIGGATVTVEFIGSVSKARRARRPCASTPPAP